MGNYSSVWEICPDLQKKFNIQSATPGIIIAKAWVGALVWELLHAAGLAKKKKREREKEEVQYSFIQKYIKGFYTSHTVF